MSCVSILFDLKQVEDNDNVDFTSFTFVGDEYIHPSLFRSPKWYDAESPLIPSDQQRVWYDAARAKQEMMCSKIEFHDQTDCDTTEQATVFAENHNWRDDQKKSYTAMQYNQMLLDEQAKLCNNANDDSSYQKVPETERDRWIDSKFCTFREALHRHCHKWKERKMSHVLCYIHVPKSAVSLSDGNSEHGCTLTLVTFLF